MAQLRRDVMTVSPVALPATATLMEVKAAPARRDSLSGRCLGSTTAESAAIVRTHDLRAHSIADGDHPETVKRAEIGSRQLTASSPTDRGENSMRDMREKGMIG